MKAAKIIAIIIIVAIIAFLVYKGVVDYKRKKVVDGIIEYAKSQGKTIDETKLRTEFYKLNNEDMNNLIAFFRLVQSKSWIAAAGMTGKVLPVLTKLNLLDVFSKTIPG